ncbi:unnamed protein product, partial [Heterosigma akashiwo]
AREVPAELPRGPGDGRVLRGAHTPVRRRPGLPRGPGASYCLATHNVQLCIVCSGLGGFSWGVAGSTQDCNDCQSDKCPASYCSSVNYWRCFICLVFSNMMCSMYLFEINT